MALLAEWLLVVLGVLLTAGTAVFVASEFALVTVDPAIVDVDLGTDRRGRSARYALKHLSTELSSAQVGITVTTILLGYTAQPAIATLLKGAMGEGTATTAASGAIAVTGSLILVNVFSMLFGELVPKNFALAAPVAVARNVVPIQRVFTRMAGWLIRRLNNSANWMLGKVGLEVREELSGARSAPELAALVRRSANAGMLDQSIAELITNSIELEELSAVDVMTDRTRLICLERTSTAADVITLARRSGHSRFPLIGDSTDDILGLVHLRKAISVPFERREEVPAAALMDDAPQVPETQRLGSLLVQLREFGMQMAVVVDEYGGTSGAVTLEDVVEELVGDVADEHDPRRSGVARTADGGWIVPGQLRPDELLELAEISVPDDGAYETLAGLVMAELGRVPTVADAITINGVTLEVAVMVGRRIERLRVRTSDSTDADSKPGSGE